MQRFWYDGQLVEGNTISLSIDDPGLLYGATVFTTLRVYDRALDDPRTAWTAHCDRLLHSINSFNWQVPDWNRIRQGAQALADDYPVLRIALFPDGREWIRGRSLPANLAQKQQEGIAAWVADTPLFRREIAGYKTGNYLPPWLALQAARQLGAGEAILINRDGDWLETSTGNLWGWRDGRWWTPPTDGQILPGIARSRLVDALTERDLPPIEQPWSARLAAEFEALAYSNSAVGIVPIHTAIAANTQHSYSPDHPSLEQLRQLSHG